MAWRKDGIGSSVAALVMGLYPRAWNKSLGDLFDELTGRKPDIEPNAAMQHGTLNEPNARRLLCDEQGVEYVPVCIVHREYPELRASVDGYAEVTDDLAEFKCPYSGTALLKTVESGVVPAHYYAQVQHLLMVSGCQRCWFRVHYVTPKGRKAPQTGTLLVMRNPKFIERMKRLELDFWTDVVYDRRPNQQGENAA